MLRLSLSVRRAAFVVAAKLEVGQGEVVCLLGHTGAGKSTLLHAVAGSEAATGFVEVDGRRLDPLPPWRRSVAIVPQRPRPLPTGRVRDQIAFATPDRRLGDDARALIDAFDLRHLADRPGHHLSGGEAQRLAIVQALASRPAVLVLDEPLSAQDPGRRRSLGPRLRHEALRRGLPVLWATHDVGEAQRVGDRVAILEEGEVRLEAAVDAMLDRPPNWQVARLLGYDGWAPAGRGEAFALHPDRVRLADAGPGDVVLAGRVEVVRPHGGGHDVVLSLRPSGEAVVALYGMHAPAPGSEVALAATDPPRLPLPDGHTPW